MLQCGAVFCSVLFLMRVWMNFDYLPHTKHDVCA